ncbi:MAG: GNAT family N-acetyltransferase [Dehalococcoidia bacterium]
MEVRALRADEGLAYRDVRLRSLRLAPAAFGSTYAEESVRDEQFWRELMDRTANAMEAELFAVDRGDGTLAGTTFVRVSPDPPHDGHVGAMWVDEDLRGGGWAEDLLTAAERFARRLGASGVTLWVEESNARARRLYERCGYLPTGVTEPSVHGGTTLLLRKDLDAFGR